MSYLYNTICVYQNIIRMLQEEINLMLLVRAKAFCTTHGNLSSAAGFRGSSSWREWWRQKGSMRKIRKDHFASCIVCALKHQSTGRCDGQARGQHSVRNFCHLSILPPSRPGISSDIRLKHQHFLHALAFNTKQNKMKDGFRQLSLDTYSTWTEED